MKQSQHVTLDIVSCLSTKLSVKLYAMQQFVKLKQFNPTNCFCKEQPNENSEIVGNKFNPISHRPCVQFGTKLKFLIAYFEEKGNSLHLIIIFYFLYKKPK